MKFVEILRESKADDFRSKFGQKFGTQYVERIVNTIKPKYLNWVGKVLDTINFEDNWTVLQNALNKFDPIAQNLPKTDINQYQSIKELVDALKVYEEREIRKVEDIEGSKKVYEDKRFYVTNPLTYESSCYYGKGTKWCTASGDKTHFHRYNSDGKLFYIIDKTKPTSDDYYKVALLKKFDGDESYWDAKDDSFYQGWILDTEEFQKLKQAISDYMEENFKEQLEIFRDAERRRKEEQRLRALELVRIRRENEEEAEERRQDEAWELGPDCPDEGLRAHALLDWLEDTSDIDKLTQEDINKLQSLKEKLEELERKKEEYEEQEMDTSEIENEIDEVGDEISEIDEKIDVYNIIPMTNDFYDMPMFELLSLPGREYVVGTEDEIKRACEEYVEGLIDDMGFDAFSKSFVESHIDDGKVRDWAYDFYYDDIRENPEIYFDDSERGLSGDQESKIELYKQKIEQNKSTIEFLEQQLYDDDVTEERTEELESKIEELQDEITEYEEEIEDIESSPEGDFDDDEIERLADERAVEASRDPLDFLREYGLEDRLDEFVDKDALIEDVIDTDGYGHTLNSYDGNADEVEVQGKWYYVMRHN